MVVVNAKSVSNANQGRRVIEYDVGCQRHYCHEDSRYLNANTNYLQVAGLPILYRVFLDSALDLH